jgi:hypothetical protein
MYIPDSNLDFLHIPDPGVKKAPDPGSGSATLELTWSNQCSIITRPDQREEREHMSKVVITRGVGKIRGGGGGGGVM